jgi:hypothetical protein
VERWPRAVSWPSFPKLRQSYLAVLSQKDDGQDIVKLLENGVANDATLFTTKEGYLGVSQAGISKGEQRSLPSGQFLIMQC